MKKIGFFGGSFNPPTIAHSKIVETAIKEFGLDKLVIIPMGDKYEKSELISFSLRYEMLKETFKYNSKIEISNMQENQIKRVFAIDSFKNINKIYNETDNYFIMGLDNYSNICNWRNSKELLENYKYIVFKRNDIDIPKYRKNVNFYNISCNISSTEARDIIKNNGNLDNILNKETIEFIRQNNLYKDNFIQGEIN